MFKDYAAGKSIEDGISTPCTLEDIKDGSLGIFVFDRGWVFIGFLTKLPNGRVRLDNAYNIHKWGTTKGLGELAVCGPQKETILFPAGKIYGNPILSFETDISLWP